MTASLLEGRIARWRRQISAATYAEWIQLRDKAQRLGAAFGACTCPCTAFVVDCEHWKAFEKACEELRAFELLHEISK